MTPVERHLKRLAAWFMGFIRTSDLFHRFLPGRTFLRLPRHYRGGFQNRTVWDSDDVTLTVQSKVEMNWASFDEFTVSVDPPAKWRLAVDWAWNGGRDGWHPGK